MCPASAVAPVPNQLGVDAGAARRGAIPLFQYQHPGAFADDDALAVAADGAGTPWPDPAGLASTRIASQTLITGAVIDASAPPASMTVGAPGANHLERLADGVTARGARRRDTEPRPCSPWHPDLRSRPRCSIVRGIERDAPRNFLRVVPPVEHILRPGAADPGADRHTGAVAFAILKTSLGILRSLLVRPPAASWEKRSSISMATPGR